MGVGFVAAAPNSAPNAQTFSLTCAANSAGINTITAVTVDTNGHRTPGHIEAVNGDSANLTALPLEFQFTATDSQGNVFSDVAAKPGTRNGITSTLTCSASLGSFMDDQGNTHTLEPTVTAFIASEH